MSNEPKKKGPKNIGSDDVTLNAGHSPWAHRDILRKLNPEKFGTGPDAVFRNDQEALVWLIRHNKYVDRTGHIITCDEQGHLKRGKETYTGPLLYKGETLHIPQGFKFDDSVVCVADVPSPTPAKHRPVPRKDEIVIEQRQITPQAELRPLAQFEPSPDGAINNAMGLQVMLANWGHPPVDAHADRSMENSRIRGGAMDPNNSEGKKFRGTRGDVKAGRIDENEQGIFFMARAGRGSRGDHGELDLSPWNLVRLDRNGNSIGTNPRHPFKVEENTRLKWIMDTDNQMRLTAVVDGSVTISDARRNDPYHKGFITDHTTASNLINQWNNTGRGQLVISQYLALNEQYTPLADKFLKGKEAPSAADAEKLLQLNVKWALHPISWSVDSRGIPVTAGDVSVLQKAQNDIFASDRFKALPQDAQDRLRAKYEPLTAQFDNPVALRQAAGDMSQWVRPLDLKADARSKLDFVADGFFDTFGKPKGHTTDAQKSALTREALLVMSKQADDASITGPSESHLRLGTGVALSTPRQSETALSAARTQWLEKFTTPNPSYKGFQQDVAAEVASDPAKLQKWTDMLFHASRNTGANSRILGFDTDSQADKFANKVSLLLGGEKYQGKLDFHGNLFGEVLNNTALLPVRVAEGLSNGVLGTRMPDISVGRGINQRRGIDKAFTDEVLRRLNDPKTHDDVVRGLQMIAAQAAAAEKKGVAIASTSLTLSLSPELAEERNGNTKSDRYRRIEGAAGPVFEDHWVANASRIGNSGAQVEQGTERQAAAGKPITTVDETTAALSIPTYLATGKGTPVIGAAVPGHLSTLRVDPVKAAGATLLGAMATADNPGKVSQGETNRATVGKVAQSSPLVFSLMAMDALAGNAGLDKASLKRLDHYLDTVDAGGEGRGGFSGYADTIHKGARAIAAAGDDPKARAAAINAASKELQAYFAAGAKAPAGSKENTLPGLAVARLAGQISEDAAVNAALVRSVLSDGKTPAGKPAVTFDGKANEADVASLKAALASDKPEERAAALKAWIADRSGDKTTGGFHIKGKLSDEQLAAVVAASNGADVDARLAGVFAAANKLAQPTDARLAGASAPAARIAGSGDILAGLLASGAITAKDREQLLALQAAPNEAARLAGVNSWLAGYVANENSKLSYTGLNLVDAAKLVIAAVIPHKPDDPKVPNNPVPGCTNCPFPDRPDIPPVIPSIPNIPNIPNPNAPVIPH